MIDYGQFCTVARGAEVFGERWTPLVVRELLCGSTRFNDIRRGVPRMSATLLGAAAAKARGDRRRQARRQRRRRRRRVPPHRRRRGAAADRDGDRPLGRALDRQPAQARPARRRLPDVGHPPLRPARQVSEEPPGRDPLPLHRRRCRRAAAGGWWSTTGSADLCRDDPGGEPTLVVESTVLALTEVWTGDRDADEAVAERAVRVRGAARDVTALWGWLGRSAFAETRAACRTAAAA